MPDALGGSWRATTPMAPARAYVPDPTRLLYVPSLVLDDCFCTPWRECGRFIIPGSAGSASAAAAASGFTAISDATGTLLTHDVPAGYLDVVDFVVLHPVSTLGIEFVTFALTDGGPATSQVGGRWGDVANFGIPLPVTGSDPLPVDFQVAGGSTIRLKGRNTDTECYQAVEVEMRGRRFDADQIRARNRRK